MPDLIAEYISFYIQASHRAPQSSSAALYLSGAALEPQRSRGAKLLHLSWEMRAGRATRESCGPCEVNQLAHDRIQREVDCSGGDDVKRVVRLVSTGLPDWSLHSRTSKTRLERLRLTPASTNLRLESTDGCVPVARRLRQELFESRASVQASAEP
jgi:hypothetical protein